MKEFKRTHCIFCEKELVSIRKLTQPIYECIDVNMENGDWIMEYGYCPACFSVQLMSLADPEVLYDEHYFQPLHHTYLWIHHNISFVKFIIDHLDTDTHDSILEIGSSSFCLGKHLIHYYPKYTVFDYTLKNAHQKDNIRYIEGNCETYAFTEDTLVLSHVFEHLYNPKAFLQNCCKNKVQHIFISVPSMEDHDQLHVGNQHTFLYSEKDLEYLFGLSQYKVNEKMVYNSMDQSFPCLFYHFVWSDMVVHVDRDIYVNRHQYTCDYLNRGITVSPNTFLATCGGFSLIMYALVVNKENIIGVIDKHSKKQGKQFGNTVLMVYPYERLKDYGKETSILVIHPKKKNIVQQIKDTNSEIQIL
jgi:hypothetical protein